MIIAGDTNIYMDAGTNPATGHSRSGWEPCGLRRATAGGAEDMTSTLHPSRHRVDTFLVNRPLLPWSLRESVRARGMAHPQGGRVGTHPGPPAPTAPLRHNNAGSCGHPLQPHRGRPPLVRLCRCACPLLLFGGGHRRTRRALPGALAGPRRDKVFEHLDAAHDAVARVPGRRQPSQAGSDPTGRDPPERWKQLQAAILRYDTLAACAPAAYQAKAVRHCVHSEAALRLMNALRGGSPGFRPATQGELQEELERQAAALEDDIRHLRGSLAAERKHAIKNFWGRHVQDIVQLPRAVRGAIDLDAPGPSGLRNMRVLNSQTLLMEAHDVMSAVRAFWRELYDKRPGDLPSFQAVLGRHMPRVREGAWALIQQYSMHDLQSALDRADGKAPGLEPHRGPLHQCPPSTHPVASRQLLPGQSSLAPRR